jgi:hypothetical protein
MTHSIRSAAAAAALLCFAATPASAQTVNPGPSGTYGAVQLTTGFEPDPHSVSVTAGGELDASSINADCNGHIARRADFTLRYRAGEELPLIISVTSEADTTLAVRAPNGQWLCNDDTNGLNPAVRWDHPRSGRYQVWVGTFGEDTAPAMLHISEVAAAGAENAEGPDFSLDPAYGSAELTSGFQPDPHTMAISAGGELDASVLGSNCVGHIARAPDYRVNFTAGSAGLPLVFSVNSDADTTLVINDAQGNWVCDDDGGNNGFNPAITFQTPASGQYDVWVGTYAEGELQPSTLNVSELYSQ